jgi:formylglycine-generating enzyme required for sulfatase activity
VPAGKFHIDKYEYPNHFGYYPEINITWHEARTKCQVQGKDLCTPEQWEMAYYGNAKKRYPYGDTYGFKDRDFCNTTGSADGVMTPSGVYENCVNDLGIYDLGGNIYEWVSLNEKNTLMADQSYQYDVMIQSLFNFDDPSHRHYFLGLRCCKCDKE